MLSYPIRLSKNVKAPVATCPDFPEVQIRCSGRVDALERAIIALEAAIAVRISYRDDVPAPSAGRYRAILPTQTAIKVRLYQAAREKGVSKRELGRRLHWHGPQVDRLFNLRHASRLDQLEAAFSALGLRIAVDVEAIPRSRQITASKSTQAPSRSRDAKTASTKATPRAPSSTAGASRAKGSAGRPAARAVWISA